MDSPRRYQVLLGCARGDLLDAVAKERGQRATSFIRDLVYDYLARTTPAELYAGAENADLRVRFDAIQRQLAGRKSKS